MNNTIQDFSTQWQSFKEQKGVYASDEFLLSYFGNLFTFSEIKGKKVAEIGSGNGRFLKILSQYADSVTGFEPSEAMSVASVYCKNIPNVELKKIGVYDIDIDREFDVIFCLGVLHHLPNPLEALHIMRRMLRPGGVLYVWVYGKENNRLYLALFRPLMRLTSRLPHKVLLVLSHFLAFFLRIYIFFVHTFRFLPWPLKIYSMQVLRPLSHNYLTLVVYDQLNPRIANYYSRSEIEDIARKAGFTSIAVYHRYAYSWTLKLN